MSNAYCAECLDKWRRTSPPMEVGDIFHGILRQRIDLISLVDLLGIELQHTTDNNCQFFEWERTEQRISLAQIRLFGSIYISTNHFNITNEISSDVLSVILRLFPSIIGSLGSIEECVPLALDLLNRGARAISFTIHSNKNSYIEQILQQCLSQCQCLEEALLPNQAPRERLQVEIDLSECYQPPNIEILSSLFKNFISEIRKKVRSILLILSPSLSQSTFIGTFARINEECNIKDTSVPLCLVFDVPNEHAKGLLPSLVPIENAMLQWDHSHSHTEKAGDVTIADCIWACLSCRFGNHDFLCPTIVTDSTGVALGLVYSTLETLKEAIRTGTGVYHSRKRGFWQKGKTSGHIQRLRRIDLDCDRDCLRFCVDQLSPKLGHLFPSSGRFCHKGSRTDWGDISGIRKLLDTLENRKLSPIEASYTNRLFNDMTFLKYKLLEEAQELSEATSTEDIAAEAADVLYFMMVRCVKAGVSIEDIERHLDEKSLKIYRRSGNTKPERIQEAEQILSINKEF